MRRLTAVFLIILAARLCCAQPDASKDQCRHRIKDTLKLKIHKIESYFQGNRAAVYEYKGKPVTKIKMLSDSTFLFKTENGKMLRGKVWINYQRCGKCLPAGTMISCPQGELEISKLKPGDSVYTSGENNERISTVIIQTNNVQVTYPHKMIEIALEDERILVASAKHPSSDYFPLDKLLVGDSYDGSIIRYKKVKDCKCSKTYDILPAGKTGTYWANGILVGSTLYANPTTTDL